MKTKIPAGSLCFQDFYTFTWPRPEDDPETTFIAKKGRRYFELVAPGYGEKCNYGNGAIFISISHFGIQWTKEQTAIQGATA